MLATGIIVVRNETIGLINIWYSIICNKIVAQQPNIFMSTNIPVQLRPKFAHRKHSRGSVFCK